MLDHLIEFYQVTLCDDSEITNKDRTKVTKG